MENEVRLVDANEIPWCHYDLENYHSFVGVDKEYVDEMPTIDPESLAEYLRSLGYEVKKCQH